MGRVTLVLQYKTFWGLNCCRRGSTSSFQSGQNSVCLTSLLDLQVPVVSCSLKRDLPCICGVQCSAKESKHPVEISEAPSLNSLLLSSTQLHKFQLLQQLHTPVTVFSTALKLWSLFWALLLNCSLESQCELTSWVFLLKDHSLLLCYLMLRKPQLLWIFYSVLWLILERG